jgi:hypothetical protein
VVRQSARRQQREQRQAKENRNRFTLLHPHVDLAAAVEYYCPATLFPAILGSEAPSGGVAVPLPGFGTVLSASRLPAGEGVLPLPYFGSKAVNSQVFGSAPCPFDCHTRLTMAR